MLTLFLHLIATGLSATAQVPAPPSGLDYRVDASVTYFTSQTNYTAGGGATQDLRNGGSFTDIIGKALYTQDLNKTQRVYGGATYSQTESSDGTITRANNGINEILAGGQWWFRMGQYRLVGAGDFVYPMYRVDRGGDDVPLGEGAMKIRLGGWFIYPMGQLTPFGYLSYEYRDEGRSHAVPYAVGAHYKMGNLWLQGEYRGYEKLFDNADTENRASRDVFLQRVSGGSYRYYAINPAMSEFAASVGYTFGTISAYGEGSYMVNGSSVADGMTFMLGLAYTPAGRVSDSDYDDDSMIDSGRTRRRSSEPIEDPMPSSDDGFLAEPDPRVAPPAPPPPPPPPPSGGDSFDSSGGQLQMRSNRPARPAPKPKPKPAPKPRTKKDKLDKMLKSTEKTLQGL